MKPTARLPLSRMRLGVAGLFVLVAATLAGCDAMGYDAQYATGRPEAPRYSLPGPCCGGDLGAIITAGLVVIIILEEIFHNKCRR